MSKIGFNLMQLIEKSSLAGERFIYPTFDTFIDLDSSFHILIDNAYHEVNIQKNENCIWFEFDYGKPDPIDNKLTNINTGEKKDNQRTNYEAELTHQLFALYDFNKNLLYLSNLNKEKMFEKMIQEKLQKQFIVKKFFKPKDEFISILQEVNEISFTEANNLFNQDSKKRQALIDLTGTAAPVKFTLDTIYPKDSKLKQFIKTLMESKEKIELKELVIKGIDEDGFGFIFNVESFIQKISISCNKEDNGKYSSSKVKTELFKRLYNDER